MHKVGAYKRAVALNTRLRMTKTADGNEWWDGIVDAVMKNKYKLLAGAGGALAGSLIGKNLGGRQGAWLGALGGGALGYGAGHVFNWDEPETAIDKKKPGTNDKTPPVSDTADTTPGESSLQFRTKNTDLHARNNMNQNKQRKLEQQQFNAADILHKNSLTMPDDELDEQIKTTTGSHIYWFNGDRRRRAVLLNALKSKTLVPSQVNDIYRLLRIVEYRLGM